MTLYRSSIPRPIVDMGLLIILSTVYLISVIHFFRACSLVFTVNCCVCVRAMSDRHGTATLLVRVLPDCSDNCLLKCKIYYLNR